MPPVPSRSRGRGGWERVTPPPPKRNPFPKNFKKILMHSEALWTKRRPIWWTVSLFISSKFRHYRAKKRTKIISKTAASDPWHQFFPKKKWLLKDPDFPNTDLEHSMILSFQKALFLSISQKTPKKIILFFDSPRFLLIGYIFWLWQWNWLNSA